MSKNAGLSKNAVLSKNAEQSEGNAGSEGNANLFNNAGSEETAMSNRRFMGSSTNAETHAKAKEMAAEEGIEVNSEQYAKRVLEIENQLKDDAYTRWTQDPSSVNKGGRRSRSKKTRRSRSKKTRRSRNKKTRRN